VVYAENGGLTPNNNFEEQRKEFYYLESQGLTRSQIEEFFQRKYFNTAKENISVEDFVFQNQSIEERVKRESQENAAIQAANRRQIIEESRIQGGDYNHDFSKVEYFDQLPNVLQYKFYINNPQATEEQKKFAVEYYNSKEGLKYRKEHGRETQRDKDRQTSAPGIRGVLLREREERAWEKFQKKVEGVDEEERQVESFDEGARRGLAGGSMPSRFGYFGPAQGAGRRRGILEGSEAFGGPAQGADRPRVGMFEDGGAFGEGASPSGGPPPLPAYRRPKKSPDRQHQPEYSTYGAIIPIKPMEEEEKLNKDQVREIWENEKKRRESINKTGATSEAPLPPLAKDFEEAWRRYNEPAFFEYYNSKEGLEYRKAHGNEDREAQKAAAAALGLSDDGYKAGVDRFDYLPPDYQIAALEGAKQAGHQRGTKEYQDYMNQQIDLYNSMYRGSGTSPEVKKIQEEKAKQREAQVAQKEAWDRIREARASYSPDDSTRGVEEFTRRKGRNPTERELGFIERNSRKSTQRQRRQQVRYLADGGSIFKPRGTDTVPAMLTPGEFVVNRKAVQTGNNLQILKSMNNSTATTTTGRSSVGSSAAVGMAMGGRVGYYNGGGLVQTLIDTFNNLGGGLSPIFDKFADAVKQLQGMQLSVKLDATNINVNFNGASFLDNLQNTVRVQVLQEVKKEITDKLEILQNGKANFKGE